MVTGAPPSGFAPGKAVGNRVGVFLMSEQNAHQVANRRAAEAAARAHGLQIDVFFADSVAAQQSQDVIRFLYAHADEQLCVVIMPVSDIDSAQAAAEEHPLQKLARRTVSRGAAWIILNRDAEPLTAALHEEFPSVPVGLVTPDQREVGRIQGRQVRRLLPRGGRLLYVLGNPFVSASRDRRIGLLDVLTAAPGIGIDEVDGYWSADKAKEAVLKRLAGAAARGEWPDVVACQNDEMSRGAYEALVAAAKRYQVPALARVPITGADGLPEDGQRWVREGRLAATIVMPTTADVAVERIAQAWKTGLPLPIKTVVPVTAFPAESVGAVSS
jgi:ABC-type sugar transport system substrate-binding protein